MTTSVDKFGRILIPKKVREFVGFKAGTEVEIIWNVEEGRITLLPLFDRPEPVLIIDELGIPTFDFGVDETFHYDFTAAIKKDREDRGSKNIGLD